MKSFQSQSVWIIGASSGIGLALAHELAERGAKLILSARNKTALDELNQSLQGHHLVLPLDVTNPEAIYETIKDLRLQTPTLHRIIYLAGHYEPGAFKDSPVASIKKIIDANLLGALNVTHAVLPLLLKQGHGQIALCGSVAGYRGLPNSQPYSATKAALINFAESLHAELKPSDIDVRIINPGFVRTPMTAKNNFAMPMMIDADDAAIAIADGLEGSSFEVHFPKRLTWPMKLLQFLPAKLFFMITKHIQS
jgi:short-subunit dehydrogenase